MINPVKLCSTPCCSRSYVTISTKEFPCRISGWSFRKLFSNGCKLSMPPSAIAPDSTLFPPSLAVIPPKIPWSKVLLESFLDQPFSLAMSPIFSAPSLANSLASACRSCTFLNVKGHNNGLRMILVLHSAVYFCFV